MIESVKIPSTIGDTSRDRPRRRRHPRGGLRRLRRVRTATRIPAPIVAAMQALADRTLASIREISDALDPSVVFGASMVKMADLYGLAPTGFSNL